MHNTINVVIFGDHIFCKTLKTGVLIVQDALFEGLGDNKNSMSRYNYHESNHHDNQYYHDIILANRIIG